MRTETRRVNDNRGTIRPIEPGQSRSRRHSGCAAKDLRAMASGRRPDSHRRSPVSPTLCGESPDPPRHVPVSAESDLNPIPRRAVVPQSTRTEPVERDVEQNPFSARTRPRPVERNAPEINSFNRYRDPQRIARRNLMIQHLPRRNARCTTQIFPRRLPVIPGEANWLKLKPMT